MSPCPPPKKDTALCTHNSASDCHSQNTAFVPERAFPERNLDHESVSSFNRAESITKALNLTSEERKGATQLIIQFPLNKFNWGLACKCVAGERSKQKWVAGKWEKEKDDIWSSYRDRKVLRQKEYTDSESKSLENSLSITVKLEKEQTTGISDFPRDFPKDANIPVLASQSLVRFNSMKSSEGSIKQWCPRRWTGSRGHFISEYLGIYSSQACIDFEFFENANLWRNYSLMLTGLQKNKYPHCPDNNYKQPTAAK